jgi:transposase-like protein
MNEDTTKLTNVIQIDEAQVRGHLTELVRGSVEETLNGLLDAEADQLVGAKRYERNEKRRDTRAGHYERKLHTSAGEVTLKVPKLRQLKLETAIIERYKRRESSVEEALIEMYLAGVSGGLGRVPGRQGGQGELAFLPPASQSAGASGPRAVHLRCVSWPA